MFAAAPGLDPIAYPVRSDHQPGFVVLAAPTSDLIAANCSALHLVHSDFVYRHELWIARCSARFAVAASTAQVADAMHAPVPQHHWLHHYSLMCQHPAQKHPVMNHAIHANYQSPYFRWPQYKVPHLDRYTWLLLTCAALFYCHQDYRPPLQSLQQCPAPVLLGCVEH